MSFRYKLKYPNGEFELSEDAYETEAEARSYAEDDVLAYASGAGLLDDMDESYDNGELEYIIIEQ